MSSVYYGVGGFFSPTDDGFAHPTSTTDKPGSTDETGRIGNSTDPYNPQSTVTRGESQRTTRSRYRSKTYFIAVGLCWYWNVVPKCCLWLVPIEDPTKAHFGLSFLQILIDSILFSLIHPFHFNPLSESILNILTFCSR